MDGFVLVLISMIIGFVTMMLFLRRWLTGVNSSTALLKMEKEKARLGLLINRDRINYSKAYAKRNINGWDLWDFFSQIT